MTDSDVEFLKSFLYTRSGLSLTQDKRYLLESRLGTLCRQHGLENITTLVRNLRTGANRALDDAVVEAMTTNETLFFRDRTPFDIFTNTVLPSMLAQARSSRVLRIWCAAVSTGQEAYSLAMILDGMASQLGDIRVEIIGTDISPNVLEKARSGHYSQFEVQRGLPVQMLLKYFTQAGDQWCVTDRLRKMVQFRAQNILEDTQRLGQFDIIFCRNLLIYFDHATKSRTLAELAKRMRPESALFLGTAETVIGLSDVLQPDPASRGVYRLAASSAFGPVDSDMQRTKAIMRA